MLHTKSLIRRLAYGPLMLTFGLVLGWAGEVPAQEIKLSIDKAEAKGFAPIHNNGGAVEVREDGGPVTITVTAKTYNAKGDHAALGVERVVQLKAEAPIYLVDGPHAGIAQNTPVDGFGRRFTMTLPTIVIPKDEKEVPVEVVFTPIPTNEENDPAVTTGDNPYKASDRITNSRMGVRLYGDSGGAVKVDKGDSVSSLVILMDDADNPSYTLFLHLNPAKISKEAEETAVTVTGYFNGATVSVARDPANLSDQTLSFLLRQSGGTAGRDADYDIELSELTIPRKKPYGSTTIYITPKNNGTGTISISSGKRFLITGTDINLDRDTRDEKPASTPSDTPDNTAAAPGDRALSFIISEIAMNVDLDADGTLETDVGLTVLQPEDYDPDGTSDNITQDAYDALTSPPANSDLNDPDGDSYWAWSEASVAGPNVPTGWDLNNNDSRDDMLKVVKEKDVLHFLNILPVDFTIDAGAIAATKGLTATPAVLRESVVGQAEGSSREEQVKLDIELKNALPDDARVRFFVRDELTQLDEKFTEDAQAATRGTHYTATVDPLTIDAGETKGSTTLNLVIYDDTGKNDARGVPGRSQGRHGF